MIDRESAAERLLEEIGIVGVTIQACGHDGTIAALHVADDRWDEMLGRAEEIARRVRSAGFRFVTLDLAGASTAG